MVSLPYPKSSLKSSDPDDGWYSQIEGRTWSKFQILRDNSQMVHYTKKILQQKRISVQFSTKKILWPFFNAFIRKPLQVVKQKMRVSCCSAFGDRVYVLKVVKHFFAIYFLSTYWQNQNLWCYLRTKKKSHYLRG